MVRVRAGDYPPYQFSKPSPAGIAVDYLDAVARRYGFRVRYIVDGLTFNEAVADLRGERQHYDLLLTFMRTPEREAQFALTADYLAAPYVLYARQDSPYIAGLENLAGKSVVVEKGFVVAEKIRAQFPAVRLVEVPRSTEALMALATGQADGYVGNLAQANYLIKERHLDNLVVAAPTPFGINTQAMAVRKDWPELASLVDKGLAALSAEERNAIGQRWGAVEYRPRRDYSLAWTIGIAALLVLLVFLTWNRALSREIGRRKRVEGDLRLAKEEAEAANRAKTTFLSTVSHELRTPLNAILGLVTVARMRAPEPKLAQNLQSIDRASRQLLGVVEGVLDIAEIEAGRVTITPVPMTVAEVLAAAERAMAAQAAERGLALAVDCPGELASQPLSGDRARLQQVLAHLARNALKFTESGAVTLRARAEGETASGVAVRWEVRDTGIGIAPEDQARLFKAFEQADQSLTRRHSGLGLGLAVCAGLVHLMGGEIGLESAPGKGSTFWFKVGIPRLPAS